MMTLTFELDKESTDGVQHVSVDDLDTKFVRSRHRYDWLDTSWRCSATAHVSRAAGVTAYRHRAPVAAARLRDDGHLEADLELPPRRVGRGGGVRLRRWRRRRRRRPGDGGEVVQGEVDPLTGPRLDEPWTLGRPEPGLLGRHARQEPGRRVTVVAGEDTNRLVTPTRRPLSRLHCTPATHHSAIIGGGQNGWTGRLLPPSQANSAFYPQCNAGADQGFGKGFLQRFWEDGSPQEGSPAAGDLLQIILQ